jgi:hypothetical protein
MTMCRAMLVVFIFGSYSPAQQSMLAGITMRQAVDIALRDYPSISVSQEQIAAAAAGMIWRGRRIFLASTRALRSIGPRATTFLACCCRNPLSSLPFRDPSLAQIISALCGIAPPARW